MVENLFFVTFSKPGGKECIVNNGLWTFGNNSVILSNCDGSLQVSYMPMSFAPFWVRINYDLPMDGMNSRTVRKIVETVGYVEDVDLPELRRPGWDEFALWQTLAMGGFDFVWIHFKYKRLPQLYYCCRLLGHGDWDCLLWIQ